MNRYHGCRFIIFIEVFKVTAQTEQEFLASYDRRDYDAPLLTVDMAIFSISNGQLQVLLVKRPNFPYKDQWALPGGFADLVHDKDLMATAYRKLVEKTGITSPYLEQVASRGNAERDPRGWAVTILYFALIDFNAFEFQSLNEYSEWVSVSKAQTLALAFDHQELLHLALERLINKTRYTALPASLIPELFTLTELQTIYEIILGQTLEKKAFRRRMVEAGAVEETGQSKVVGKRPAQLYRYALDSFDFTFPRSLELPKKTLIENEDS